MEVFEIFNSEIKYDAFFEELSNEVRKELTEKSGKATEFEIVELPQNFKN